MVKLNMNILLRSTSGRVARKSDESHEQYLMKITHLYLENKQLNSISNEIGLCKNLVVCYLYDNNLSEMPDLGACQSLSHLYIQNNHISRIEHLEYLSKLTKIYVGQNKISFVEGLHTNMVLQELYIENQKLFPGEMLLFDPRSIASIASTLTTLNISGNGIDSLDGIRLLKNLKQLLATDNKLESLEETMSVLAGFRQLHRLELMQNPICAIKKYRDLIIVTVVSLESLDGKEVTETSRQFLINWKANRDAVDRKKEDQKAQSGLPNYMTAHDMRFSSSQVQMRQIGPARHSGRMIRPMSVSSK